MDIAIDLMLLLTLWAALIDLLRRGSLTYPTTRDVCWVAVEGALFATCGGLLVDAGGATTVGWAAACATGFAVLLELQRDPSQKGTPEPSTTSETGNKVAFVGGLLVLGLLIGAALALDGWPAFSFLVIAALLIARLATTRRPIRKC